MHCIQFLKPGLHIVVKVAEHACDDATKKILKPSTYRLKIFLVKYQNLRPLQKFRDQITSVNIKYVFVTMCLRSLRLIWRPGLKKHEKNVAIMLCTKSTNCLQSEIYFQYDTICEISPKKNLLLISNLEHSHFIDCTRQLHLGALFMRWDL